MSELFKKLQQGGFIEAKNWTTNYLKSPKYKERQLKMNNTEVALTGTTQPSVDSMVQTRLNNINLVKPTYVKNDISGNSNVKGELDTMDNLLRIRTDLGETGSISVHELSHASTRGEQPYSQAFNYKYPSNTMIKPGGSAMTNRYDPYIQSPTEVKARLDSIRFQMSKKGLYDAGTQDFTNDSLQKLQNDKQIINSDDYKSLEGQLPYDRKGESLKWLMNNIAKNKTQLIPTAQQGTKLTSKQDNTRVVPMRLAQNHADMSTDAMQDYTKMEQNLQRVDALKKMLLKYGNPGVTYSNFSLDPRKAVGKYNIFTNNIVLDKDMNNSSAAIKSSIIAELAHSKQRQDIGLLGMIGRGIKDIPNAIMGNQYDTQGTLEFEAHGNIQNSLNEEYDDLVKDTYKYNGDLDDPDLPDYARPGYKKPLSKLELLKKNNKPTVKYQRGGALVIDNTRVSKPKMLTQQEALDNQAASQRQQFSERLVAKNNSNQLRLKGQTQLGNGINDMGTNMLSLVTKFGLPSNEEIQQGRGSWGDRSKLIANSVSSGLSNELMGGALNYVSGRLANGLVRQTGKAADGIIRHNLDDFAVKTSKLQKVNQTIDKGLKAKIFPIGEKRILPKLDIGIQNIGDGFHVRAFDTNTGLTHAYLGLEEAPINEAMLNFKINGVKKPLIKAKPYIQSLRPEINALEDLAQHNITYKYNGIRSFKPSYINVNKELQGKRLQDVLYQEGAKEAQRRGAVGVKSGEHLLSPAKTAKAHERFERDILYNKTSYGLNGITPVEHSVVILKNHRNPNITMDWLKEYNANRVSREKLSVNDLFRKFKGKPSMLQQNVQALQNLEYEKSGMFNESLNNMDSTMDALPPKNWTNINYSKELPF